MKAKAKRWRFGLGLSAGFCLIVASLPLSKATAETRARVLSPDDQMAEIARIVPDFGGMFMGPDNVLHVYLLDVAKRAAVENAIATVFGKERVPSAGIKVLQGRYGFLELQQWHNRQSSISLAIPGVILTSIKKSENRLKIGVRDSAIIPRVEQVLSNLGIPRDAAIIVEVDEVERQVTLVDVVRPVIGGINVQAEELGACTLGFAAVRAGVAGFVTNSHCTTAEGQLDERFFFQPTESEDDIPIGKELFDPPFFTFPLHACPLARKCRFSDSAFVELSDFAFLPPVQVDFGYIAGLSGTMFPPYIPTLTIHTKFRITEKAPVPLEGESVSKVGRTSGRTDGVVSDTCENVNVKNRDDVPSLLKDVTLLCQYRATYLGLRGDSGSPVFSWSSALLPPGALPPSKLLGINWGGVLSDSYFSALAFIELELGPLKVFPGDIGPNSPPRVKILKPKPKIKGLVFSVTVGVGGFGVEFSASAADYESGCCQWSWTSDNPADGGTLSTTHSFWYTFATPGNRRIKVTVTDADGAKASDEIFVHVTDDSPTVWMIEPYEGRTFFKGFTYIFQGTSYDPNEVFFTLPCTSLSWFSSEPQDNSSGTFPKTGCAPQVTFESNGIRMITLYGTDSQGQPGYRTRKVWVKDAPVNSPPVVTILRPQPGEYLDPNENVFLRGKAKDPDNKNPLSHQWTVSWLGSETKVLGEGSSQSGDGFAKVWRPADTVPFHCGGVQATMTLHVTDPDGQEGLKDINVVIGYPPC
jgi:hypothetical protein